MTSSTTIRLDDKLKKDLQRNLDAAGISMNTYFVMAAKQMVLQKRIPFEVLTEPETPNAESMASINEAIDDMKNSRLKGASTQKDLETLLNE